MYLLVLEEIQEYEGFQVVLEGFCKKQVHIHVLVHNKYSTFCFQASLILFSDLDFYEEVAFERTGYYERLMYHVMKIMNHETAYYQWH